MLIKKKSLLVSLVSSFVIALVLILTLVGYFVYIELKGEEFRRKYQDLLGEAKARVYSKHIDIFGIDAKIENAGTLKGKPVIEGVVINKGERSVYDIALKVSFLDKDGAIIYETVLEPQEPSLSQSMIPRVNIPYLYTAPRRMLKSGERIAFKKIIESCPTEIFIELREGNEPKKTFGKWSGKLSAQLSSLDF